MTAPPTQRPLFAAGPQMPFMREPECTTNDLSGPWTAMVPIDFNAQRPRKPSSPNTSKSKSKGKGSGHVFITVTKPADFKDRGNMTVVRQQAMGSYLQKGKKLKGHGRSRKQSKDSNSSVSPTSATSEQSEAFDAVVLRRTPSNQGHQEAALRRTSSVPSPASNASSRRTATPERRVSSIPASLAMVLSSAPMVRPNRINVVLPYLEASFGPFQSLGKPFDPFRSMFQPTHPRVSAEELKYHCHNYFGTRAMGQHWIPAVVKSSHGFLSTLCIASSHHDAVHSLPTESFRTTALRQEVMHLIQQNLLNPATNIDDDNVISLTQLIASELIAGEERSVSFHEDGVVKMVDMRGGLEKLGVKGRLASTLSWISLGSAILREAKPRAMYTAYCAKYSERTYPNTATIPESPLFVPRGEYVTVVRSSRCLPRTLELLKDIRMMIDLFLHETKNSRQNIASLKSLYRKITTQYPTAAVLQQSTVMTPAEWIYEVTRVASVIQATAIMNRIPLSDALELVAQSENAVDPESPLGARMAKCNSSDSLNKYVPMRHDSPVTGFSTSPTYSTSFPVPAPNYFGSEVHTSRPSISSASTYSTSSSSSLYTTSTSPTTTSLSSFSLPTTSDFLPPSSFFPNTSPAPAPSPTHTRITNLRTVLEASDLSDCWNDLAGVLLWTSLIFGAASRRNEKVMRKWYSALAMRCCIVLCFEHMEPVHATMVRMCEVVTRLGGEEEEGGVAKRRRV